MAARDANLRIEVEGLKEARKALKAAGDGMDKDLGQAGKKAADIVARTAAPRVPVRTGAAARSMRPKVSYGGGAVVFGGAKVPYAGWLEFGGRVGRDKSVTRDVIKGGRYIYPVLAEKRDEVVDTYEELVRDVLRRAGLT